MIKVNNYLCIIFILLLLCMINFPCQAHDDSSSSAGKTGLHNTQKPVPVYSGPQAAGYFLIRFYQLFISPQDGPNCRHQPTCSAYGREAVKAHGILIGAVMAGDRILRCNPYMDPMVDPVPEKLPEVKTRKRTWR